MNKVILLGRLTKDPEIIKKNENTLAKFGLAVNRKFAKEGEQTADFINIVAWNKLAELVEKYLKKGKQVAVVGRLQTRNWEDDNGNKKYVTEVVAEELTFTGKKTESEEKSDEVQQDYFTGDSSDDLPF